jgi:hypothetical protein
VWTLAKVSKDAEIMSALLKQQLEDPNWTEAHGLTVGHFSLQGDRQYMMIGPPWNKDAQSLWEFDNIKNSHIADPKVFDRYRDRIEVSRT